MRPDLNPKKHNVNRPQLVTPAKQQGSLIALSIFVVVILAVLGLSIANQLQTASQNVVYEVQGTRAVLAARTGLEILAAQTFPVGAPVAACNQAPAVTSLAALDGMQTCQVSTRCQTLDIEFNGNVEKRSFQFESTGVCQSGGQWVSRTLAREAIIEVVP